MNIPIITIRLWLMVGYPGMFERTSQNARASSPSSSLWMLRSKELKPCTGISWDGLQQEAIAFYHQNMIKID